MLFYQLDFGTTEEDLKELFAIAGTVIKVQYNCIKGQAVIGKILERKSYCSLCQRFAV